MKKLIYITLIMLFMNIMNIWLSVSANGQAELSNPIGQTDILNVISAISRFLAWIGVPIAIIFILYGAFLLITAAGNPEKIETGKRAIWWAIAGLIIILLSEGIISIVTNLFGSGGSNSPIPE